MGEQYEREEIEQALVCIWREVLKMERVGRDDNFFELGGDSLLGMDVLEKISDRLAVQPPFFAILQFPTVREMAQWVEQERSGSGEDFLAGTTSSQR